jgi:hypothetical protein
VIELGLVDLRTEDDVVRAHQTTRTIPAQLGFSTFEQTNDRARLRAAVAILRKSMSSRVADRARSKTRWSKLV